MNVRIRRNSNPISVPSPANKTLRRSQSISKRRQANRTITRWWEYVVVFWGHDHFEIFNRINLVTPIWSFELFHCTASLEPNHQKTDHTVEKFESSFPINYVTNPWVYLLHLKVWACVSASNCKAALICCFLLTPLLHAAGRFHWKSDVPWSRLQTQDLSLVLTVFVFLAYPCVWQDTEHESVFCPALRADGG